MALAGRVNAELIAMDSMTHYRGMDIGTAKPTREERQRVPHHLVDVIDPWESASVAWWRERAMEAVTAIRDRGRQPLFVGGTPFYFMALRYGLFAGPPADEAIRDRLDAEVDRVGLAVIHDRLKAVDPVAAARIHPNDRRRIVRALEVFESTGRPLSSFQTDWNSPGFGNETESARLKAVRIDWPREVLYARIDERVSQMLAGGWRDECERLLALPYPLSREAEKAIGYRELIHSIREPGSIPDVESLIALRTRQFAKRQLTWFRRFTDVPVVQGDDASLLDRMAELWG
jgi:tRNA dimethylallyltransferase